MNDVVENGVDLIEQRHLDEYSLWRDDQDKDLYFPVRSADEMPELPGDLIIKADFFAPNKMSFSGYIKGINKGIDKLLYINIFYKGQSFGFNYNLPKLCHDHLNELISLLPAGSVKDKDDLFPIRYETRFELTDQGYNNFWGEFDAFLKER